MTTAHRTLPFLPTRSLRHIPVCICTSDSAREALLSVARTAGAATVEFLAVNNFVLAVEDRSFGEVLATMDYVFPDGAPIAWSINGAANTEKAEQITARELTVHICEGAARQGIPVYFYGSTSEVIRDLAHTLQRKFPKLKIAGYEASTFRPLTEQEDRALIDRINESGARIVFVGLGCPLQEQFVSKHRTSINAVQLCVGSAFMVLAGHLRTPPKWIQRIGLEWMFRLIQEPRRLWRRYLRTNATFLWMLLRNDLHS